MHLRRQVFLPMVAFMAGACGAEVPTDGEEVTSQSQALGVSGPAFYVDGEFYRTVGTPTEFREDQPEHSFDVIYDFGGLQPNVADAAPGATDYNGGRWMVHAIEFEDYEAALLAHDANDSGDFDSASEVESALEAGDADDLGVVRRFECPAIPLPRTG